MNHITWQDNVARRKNQQTERKRVFVLVCRGYRTGSKNSGATYLFLQKPLLVVAEYTEVKVYTYQEIYIHVGKNYMIPFFDTDNQYETHTTKYFINWLFRAYPY